MKILAVSGSLKVTSTNTTLLRAAATLAPDSIQFEIYDGLADLPHFTPDLDTDDALKSVQHWRDSLKSAQAVIICTPEYAYGMPGSLKNALDWTVSSGEFVGKAVAAWSASPNAGGAIRAQESLILTLTALSANVIEGAKLSVPSIRSKIDGSETITDTSLAQDLKRALESLLSSP